MSASFTLDTPRGPTAGVLDTPASASAVVVLGHGAGSGMESPFMAGIARALAGLGLAVARFDFPYMHAGRKPPDPAPALVETWRLARDAVAERTGLPLVAGGKSLGGRIASMAVAEGMAADALVFLGYPLHPPGRPEKLRRDHLAQVAVPMLFLQGSRDAFAQPDLLAETVAGLGERARLVKVAGGDHSFRVAGGPRDGAEIGAGLAPAVADFVAAVVAGPS
ncbi:MAG: alpha/beta hydrolase family protein [Gaiellales bacterium]